LVEKDACVGRELNPKKRKHDDDLHSGDHVEQVVQGEFEQKVQREFNYRE